MTINPDDATLYFKHTIYYSNRNVIPAEEVAEALLALSRLVERTPRLLRQLAPGISTPKARLYVEKLESGSLTEDIIVAFGFGSKKKMDRTLRVWGKRFGFDLTTRAGVIRALIAVLVLAGGYYAYQRANTPAPTPSAHVEIKDNVILQIGAKELGRKPEDLLKLVELAIHRKDRLAGDAIAVVKPAKRDPNASIQFDGDPALSIPAQTIAAIPNEMPPDKAEKSVTHEGVDVRLRAVDLDSPSSGWAAVVPEINPRRVRLELTDTINPDELFGRKSVRGTVEAVFRKNVHGQSELRLYRLLDVEPDAGEKAAVISATGGTADSTAKAP